MRREGMNENSKKRKKKKKKPPDDVTVSHFTTDG